MAEVSRARYRAGSGEPVVLLHGFTATWRCWLPVLPDLVARYDVFAPTLTGHHGGPPVEPDQTHSLPAAAEHVERQLDEAGIDTAHLVGNSMGGALALELAKKGRARSVVGLSPGAGWHEGDPEGPRIEKFFRRQLKMTRATKKNVHKVMKSPVGRRLAMRDIVRFGEQITPDEAVEMALSSLECTVVEDVFAAVRTGEALLRDLDQVRVPTLVAWAEFDRVLPMRRHAARFQAEIPGVTFRVLPNVGHVPMSDDPKLIGETIIGWVERNRAASADSSADEPERERAAA